MSRRGGIRSVRFREKLEAVCQLIEQNPGIKYAEVKAHFDKDPHMNTPNYLRQLREEGKIIKPPARRAGYYPAHMADELDDLHDEWEEPYQPTEQDFSPYWWGNIYFEWVDAQARRLMEQHNDFRVANKYRWKAMRAYRSGHDFTLSFEDFSALITQTTCAYTGEELLPSQPGVDSKDDCTLTIDRINSDKGYIPGNCVACSARANRLKNELFESRGWRFKDVESVQQAFTNLNLFSEVDHGQRRQQSNYCGCS